MDNSDAIQQAFDFSAAQGKLLVGSEGTYTLLSTVLVPSNLRFDMREITRLEKNFTTTGDNAMLMAADDFVTDVTLSNINLGASAHEILGVKTNKVLNLVGDRIKLLGGVLDTWSGWGLTLHGDDNEIHDIEAINPFDVGGESDGNGVDAFHFGGGDGCKASGLTGLSGDDFLIFASPKTGPYANRDVSNFHAWNCNGRSLHARGFVAGCWDDTIDYDTSSGLVEDCTFEGNAGTGSVYIPSLGALGGETRDITLRRVTMIGGTSLSALSLRQSGLGSILRVTVEDPIMTGGTDFGIQTIGAFADFVVTGSDLDASMCASHAVTVIGPNGASAFSYQGDVQCGAGSGFNIATGLTNISALDIAATVSGIKDGQWALECNNMTGSTIDLVATREPGATTSGGVKEGVLASGNTILGDYSGVDIPYEGP